MQTTQALRQMYELSSKNVHTRHLPPPSDQYLKNNAGSTATIALITPNRVYVSNIGDSRTVICFGGKDYNMSVDHKPNLEQEEERIKAAGLNV